MSTWALRTPLSTDEVNLHLPALEAAGLLGVVEELDPAGRRVATTLYLSERVPQLPIPGTWEEVPDRDWLARWRATVEPVKVGPLVILPPWWESPAAEGATPLLIEPAQAFGTGHHETTTGCLAALLETELRGRRVLDVGTGTGVLAIAAAKLGAREVVACDVDPLAIEAAADNARLNEVTLELHEGSLDAVPEGTFDVVVANLDTSTISELAKEITARLAPRGLLIASGVSVPRRHEAEKAFAAAGLPVAARTGSEWVVLTGLRTA